MESAAAYISAEDGEAALETAVIDKIPKDLTRLFVRFIGHLFELANRTNCNILM
ncbi:MAG: hypothetical protein H7144_09565 [Burkholderiales bacterium]|nr:hypothetical protein [Phycisphaerae bacterium]